MNKDSAKGSWQEMKARQFKKRGRVLKAPPLCILNK